VLVIELHEQIDMHDKLLNEFFMQDEDIRLKMIFLMFGVLDDQKILFGVIIEIYTLNELF
jgi:hypothetical protein